MAEDSRGTLVSFFLITIFFGILYFVFPVTILGIAALSALLITLFSFYFFRDPKRSIPGIRGGLISPADGKVILVEDVDKHLLTGKPAKLISIFLNLNDVHVNRIPIDGKISSVSYKPGKFLKAFVPEAGDLNEQYLIKIETEFGLVYLKQIAGIIARRLVCRLKENDEVSCGEKFGLMKFSSRIDLIIPDNFNIMVKVGDRVVGGETLLAKVRDIE